MKIIYITNNDMKLQNIKNKINFNHTFTLSNSIPNDLDIYNVVICDKSYLKDILCTMSDFSNRTKLLLISDDDFITRDLENILFQLRNENNKITLCTNTSKIDINIKDISYFKIEDRKSYVYTNELTLIKHTKSEIVSIIKDNTFIEVYVGIYVNLNHIKEIKSRDIILKNNQTLFLSQKKASLVRSEYKKFLSNLLENMSNSYQTLYL